MTYDAVATFFETITRANRLESASDHNGNDIKDAVNTDSANELLESTTGSIHSVFSSTTLPIKQFQVFVYWGPDQQDYFVEITFFPEDLVAEDWRTFQITLAEWNELLRADDYFVRFENASWEEYSHTDDVICTRKLPPT